jgi:ribonuclease G
MKGESVILDHYQGRKAAAWMEDGRLKDLLIDAEEALMPGTILRARVDRTIKGQGGVFVTLPDGASGYLRGVQGLAIGQPLLVQVTGFPDDGKAVPVTQKVLFKSKFAIVTPDAPGLNISRSIKDEEQRAHLRILAEDVLDGTQIGLILRSQAALGDEAEIAEDIAEMVALAQAIQTDVNGDPEILIDGPDAHHMAWREWGDPTDLDTEAGAFEHRGVLDEIELLSTAKAMLPNGGYMWIEPTRALIAVDVNSGPDISLAATLKTNLAAAKELPRQLRLRGLGGQITLDLAPLAKKDRKQFENALRNAFRADSVETSLVGWTPLGHYELQRKRERLPLF